MWEERDLLYPVILWRIPLQAMHQKKIRVCKTPRSIKTAAGLTAFYSDCEEKEVRVKFGKETFDKEIVVSPTNLAEIDTLRIKKRAVTSQLVDTGLKV